MLFRGSTLRCRMPVCKITGVADHPSSPVFFFCFPKTTPSMLCRSLLFTLLPSFCFLVLLVFVHCLNACIEDESRWIPSEELMSQRCSQWKFFFFCTAFLCELLKCLVIASGKIQIKNFVNKLPVSLCGFGSVLPTDVKWIFVVTR